MGIYMVWAIAGALLWAGMSEFYEVRGILIGALFGVLGSMIWKLGSRLNQQQTRLELLEQQLLRREPVAPEEPVSVPPPEVVAEPVDELVFDTIEPGLAAQVKSPPSPAAVAEPISRPVSPPARQRDEPGLPPFLDKLKQWVIAYFTGGNLMVRVGVLILFFGVAFLLKYAAQKVVVPIELRYLGIMLAATVLLVIGWRSRRKNTQFALVAQGGAVGILYLVVFAAYHLHSLMGTGAAFGLLIAVVVLSAVIAILQDAVWLAAVGVTGGFLAPILVSTGSGSHVALFSYYLILNLGIALVAFYRSWRLLNWLGFVFTFGIGTAWGARSYHAEFFPTTEPYLVAFFLLYTLLPLLFAIKQPPQLKGVVDGTLVFGAPVAFMGLQSKLAEGELAVANLLPWSSAALGVLYLALAFLVWRRAALRLLSESYLAMSVAFLTLAVPLAYDGRVTAAVWAIEGAALIWVGLRQARLLPRLSGIGLVLVASLFYGKEPAAIEPTLFLLNADYVGAVLLAFAAGLAAWLFQRYHEVLHGWELRLATKALALLAFGWWVGGGIAEIHRHFSSVTEMAWLEGLMAVTAVACWWIAVRYQSRMSVGLALLTVVGGVVILILGHRLSASDQILWNVHALSTVLLVASTLWMALHGGEEGIPQLHILRNVQDTRQAVRLLLTWLAAMVALIEGLLQCRHFLPTGNDASAFLIYGALILYGLVLLHKYVPWSGLMQPVLLLLPLLALIVLAFVQWDFALWSHRGWLAFPVAVTALYLGLHYQEQVTDYSLGGIHVAAILLWVFTGGWQLAQLFGLGVDPMNAWMLASWGIVLIVSLLAMRALSDRIWPFTAYPEHLAVLAPRILVSLLGGWIVVANLIQPGEFGALLDLPVLNPLDLTCVVALLLLFKTLYSDDAEFLSFDPRLMYIVPGALLFLVLNGAVLRACHLIMDIPYAFTPMFRSFAVESAISVLWSGTALVVMILATRKHWRTLWLTGGALMGLVVLKLFAVDMSGTGSIARIVAFITVGVLLLVVGYFAPMPPRSDLQDSHQDSDEVTV